MKEIFVCKADSLSLLDDDIKRKRPTLTTYVCTTWHDKHMAQEISFYDMTSL